MDNWLLPVLGHITGVAIDIFKEKEDSSEKETHKFYTSTQYQKLLKTNKLGQSMSRRGNCWDNATQEYFFGHLKDHVDNRSCKTLQEIRSKVDDYIQYYNNHRYQWERQKMTPVQYRNHLLSLSSLLNVSLT